jgi:hypothetical protein
MSRKPRPPMPLGLVDAYMLALDIGYQTSGGEIYLGFGALVEVIPLRHAYLILIMGAINYNGAADRLCG